MINKNAYGLQATPFQVADIAPVLFPSLPLMHARTHARTHAHTHTHTHTHIFKVADIAPVLFPSLPPPMFSRACASMCVCVSMCVCICVCVRARVQCA